MFEPDDIRDWRDMAVVDRDGEKIGTLESVYFDTATDTPAFAAVKTGLVSKRLVFVPLGGARVSPRHLRVLTEKNRTKDAPSIDTDGELTTDREPELFQHYGLDYRPGDSGERRLGRR